jgi:hypothetical protein
MRRRWNRRWIPFAVTWGDRPLKELSLEKSKWKHSERLFEIEVAYEWHRLPSEFGICDKELDLTFMAAYIITKRKIEAWENKQAIKQARINARKNSKR